MSVPLGIDFGNANTTIAAARNRGIDVLVNEVSNRSTPSLVAFGYRNRFMGESAKTQETSNMKNTVGSLKRLLGRQYNDPDVQNEQKFLASKLVDVKGQVGVKVNYLGKEETFTATQLVAMFLSKIKATAFQETKAPVSDVVLTVPGWYTDVQRRAFVDAAHIAGLNPVRLVNEDTAAAITYGVFKTDLPEDKPRHVCFVDVGHSSYNVSIVAFKKGQLKVVGVGYDRFFGGRDIDYALGQFFADQFKEKYKIDIRKNLKAYQRVLTQVEKLKKVLSANAAAPISIESVMEDIDVSSKLERAELEELISGLLKRINNPAEAALKQSGLSKEDIFSVEVVGGSSRVPIVKETISKFFDRPLSFTMNQDEAIARGAAFVAAIHSPTLRVRPFKYEDLNNDSVTFSWEPLEGDEESELEVFPKGNVVPSLKVITLFRKADFDIEAKYTNPAELPGAINPWIGRWSVKGVKPNDKGEDVAVKLRLRLDASGLYMVESAYSAEEVEVEEPIPEEGGSEEKKEGEEEGEEPQPPKMRKVKKWVKKDTLNIVHGSTSLEQSIKNSLIELENQMYNEDKLVFDTEERKNALEEYIYDMRGKLDDLYADFASPQEKATLHKKLEAAEEWLYGDGEDASKAKYVSKLEDLQSTGNLIRGRYLSKLEEEKEARRKKQEDAEKQKLADQMAAEREARAAADAKDKKDDEKKEGEEDVEMKDA